MRIFGAIFPKRRLVLASEFIERLRSDPVHVIDVGGALGADPRWAALPESAVRFMTFEPDARSQEQMQRGGEKNLALPVGLADVAGRRVLHLTEGPFASSLYPPNDAVLQDFGVWPWYRSAGSTLVECDTLDACMSRHPDWRADFIKVDVEGADLDVLKGGRRSLDNAFGVQIEVAFVARNIGAPLQPDMDIWMRKEGFVPHILIREHWVRANGIHGALSRPQLIWADAVYFRGKDWVLTRIGEAANSKVAEVRLASILAILLAYDAHDYAGDIIAAARTANLIEPKAADAAEWSVKTSLTGLAPYVVRGVLALLIALPISAVLALMGGRSRTVGRDLVIAQAGPLFDALSRATRRGGLSRSCLSDF